MKSDYSKSIELRAVAAQIISRIRNSPTPHLMSSPEIDARIGIAESLKYQYDDVPVDKLLNGVLYQHRSYRKATDEQISKAIHILSMLRRLDPSKVPLDLLDDITVLSPSTVYHSHAARLFNAVHRQDNDAINRAYDALLVYVDRTDADPEGIVFCMRYLPPAAALVQRSNDFGRIAEETEKILDRIDQRLVPQWVVTMTSYTSVWNRVIRQLFRLSASLTDAELARSPRSAADLELAVATASLESGDPIAAVEHAIISYLATLSLGSETRMYHRSAMFAALPMLVSGRVDDALIDAALKTTTENVSYRYSCYELLSPAIISGDLKAVSDLLVRHALHPTMAEHQNAYDRPVYHLVKDLNALNIDPSIAEKAVNGTSYTASGDNEYLRSLYLAHLAGMFAIAGQSDKVREYASVPPVHHKNVHIAWYNVARNCLHVEYGDASADDAMSSLIAQVEMGVKHLVDDLVAALERDSIVAPRMKAQEFLQQLKDERSETLQQYRTASRELSELRDTLASEVEDRNNALRSLDSGRTWLVNELTRELSLWRHIAETRLLDPDDRESASAVGEKALTQITHLNQRLQLI